jgi:ABC-type transport system involved in multi-copper enzyme maturation permease subunit
MKKDEKIMMLILLIILGIVLIIFFINKNINKDENNNVEGTVQEKTQYEVQENQVEENVEVQEDGTKLNVSEKLNETKDVDEYKFENISFSTKNGETIISADVTNTSEKETPLKSVDITLLDEEGNEIITIGGLIQALQPGETGDFNATLTLDYANTYDFTIKVVD